ncbi:MAG: alpha/beta hydrolase [Clostridia bacterium]|nr:alpha/beta hydrolase [Clostridia bacterium]
MFWTVFIITAAVILILLAVTLYYICRKLFDMALVRGSDVVIGGDGFEKQLAEYKDMWDNGKKLFDSLDKEEVWMKSFDGLNLHATLVKNGDGKKLLIEAHGYRSSPKHDFIAAMPYFYNHGFSFLLIDQRAHGESEGDYITFGVHERLDMRDWVYFAMEKFGTDIDIVLHGISMGATTVLLASELDLPENVKGIIADSGFTSPYEIFARVLDHTYHAKPFPILNVAEAMAQHKANFGFKDASTLSAMEVNKFPILFVHGEDDDFVPIEMSEATYNACKTDKAIVKVKGARHACGYLVEKERCEKEMDAFLAKIL